jgi:hypothetical protein
MEQKLIYIIIVFPFSIIAHFQSFWLIDWFMCRRCEAVIARGGYTRYWIPQTSILYDNFWPWFVLIMMLIRRICLPSSSHKWSIGGIYGDNAGQGRTRMWFWFRKSWQRRAMWHLALSCWKTWFTAANTSFLVMNPDFHFVLAMDVIVCTAGVRNVLRTSVCTRPPVLESEVLWSGLEFVMMVALSSKLFKEHWML